MVNKKKKKKVLLGKRWDLSIPPIAGVCVALQIKSFAKWSKSNCIIIVVFAKGVLSLLFYSIYLSMIFLINVKVMVTRAGVYSIYVFKSPARGINFTLIK